MKQRLRTKIFLSIALLGSMILAISCSTKKNTFTRRVYHNLTTHYNIYWNGNESFKNGLADLNKNLRDNYNKILLVNNYGTADDSRKIYSAMDRAIEKATIAIQRHSLYFKKTEYNRWIDDCYMLIGKAQFYKQDYNSARRTFDFVMKQYIDNPVQYEALLWQIKTNIQQKKYEDAFTQLDQLDGLVSKEKVPFSVRRDIPLVYADYYILNNNLSTAKTYLEQGLELTTDRKFKMRLDYILAQINQQDKNFPKATEYYTRVIKGPASFEMAFNARINMARSFDIYSGDKSNLQKQLRKMLKDGKNKDFRDQIYFALSELAELDKNDTLVMHYLKLSVGTSVNNDYQKTTSALKLANMSFDRLNYENAKAYYDTTLQVLPKDYPDYEAINNRTLTLSDLITNLQVVQYEDSMQRLGRIPEAELTAIIQKVIDEYNRKEKQRLEEEQQQQMDIAMAGNTPNLRNERIQDLGGGGWYFNNPAAISLGYSEFMRKWGRRKLEDNWRLSNKRAVANFSPDEADNTQKVPGDSLAPDSKTKKGAAVNPKDPKTYLQLIPKSPEAIAASNDKISEALLNLGYIYKDGLKDITKSVQAFEDLLSRFPDTKEALRIYYQLYLMGKDIPDEVMAAKYKDKIIAGYGDSDYAMIIENPDYNKEVLAKKNRVQSLYEETYQAFSRGQYRMVLLYSNEALSTYQDKDLLPKFEYLRALSVGKTENMDTMLVLLNKMVKVYPNSSVTPMAKELIQKYGKNAPVAAIVQPSANQPAGANNPSPSQASGFTTSTDTVVPTIYKYSPGQTHFYIIMLNEARVNVSATKIRLTDFISKSFNNDNLSVNAIVLDGGWQMITISSFRNSQAAMNFYGAVKLSDYVMAPIKEGDSKQFIISMENYPIFYREKKYDGYINFFNKNYSK